MGDANTIENLQAEEMHQSSVNSPMANTTESTNSETQVSCSSDSSVFSRLNENGESDIKKNEMSIDNQSGGSSKVNEHNLSQVSQEMIDLDESGNNSSIEMSVTQQSGPVIEENSSKRKIDQDNIDTEKRRADVSTAENDSVGQSPKRLKSDISDEKVTPISGNNTISPRRSNRQKTPSAKENSSQGSEKDPLIVKDLDSAGTSTESKEKSAGEKLTKRQEERLAKQKLREAEKIERDRKKEEERLQKKEERERKELERKQKRESLEKEKQEKREQERLRKEERRLRLEEEKKAKEQERKNKEDERKKAEEMKDRNQMKISNFFAVKPAPKQPTVVSFASSASSSSIKSSKPSTPIKESKKSPEKDSYEIDFLPFFQKKNVLLAPHTQLSQELLNTAKSQFDAALTQDTAIPKLEEFFANVPLKPAESFTSTQKMVDALNSSQMSESSLVDLVNGLPAIKYLQFYENAKPPYVGTWCSEKHMATALTPQSPLDTTLTGFDYDYDSDLDWQEGDEGDEEDIDDLDEGEEEEDDVEDDEMEDFVDNTETSKRGHVGPLQSVSIWNDGTNDDVFEGMKYERLHLEIEYPIDPFKNYWSVSKETKEPKESKESKESKSKEKEQITQGSAESKPPKPVISVSQLGTPVKSESKEKSQTPNVLTPQKPVIKDKDVVANLVEFIKKNSDFSIGTLSELAKKEFKIYTKSLLKHTIQEVAFYNKKTSTWEIKNGTAV